MLSGVGLEMEGDSKNEGCEKPGYSYLVTKHD